ncbi:MAG: 50S ribosomal protein L21 [Desulfomonile sp.]|jgi:large subunit ribosomal protein L21|nr:50S ribosomal protein L21 [Deltaproteobacteria bacterium]
MYAIVQTGGKQYKVQPGEQLKIEKIPGDPGSEIALDQVLALSTPDGIDLGRPFVDNASVKATIMRTARDRKIVVFKKKKRKGYHKKQGHRQWYTLLKIEEIVQTPLSGMTEVMTAIAPEQSPA